MASKSAQKEAERLARRLRTIADRLERDESKSIFMPGRPIVSKRKGGKFETPAQTEQRIYLKRLTKLPKDLSEISQLAQTFVQEQRLSRRPRQGGRTGAR
ncbi:MAG: hypothetical protein A49_31600 [Methyloceanibacter sp.]|nr:MAG: hypothetical protein A49_31600 [Methyloceanibacter sp.]